MAKRASCWYETHCKHESFLRQREINKRKATAPDKSPEEYTTSARRLRGNWSRWRWRRPPETRRCRWWTHRDRGLLPLLPRARPGPLHPLPPAPTRSARSTRSTRGAQVLHLPSTETPFSKIHYAANQFTLAMFYCPVCYSAPSRNTL